MDAFHSMQRSQLPGFYKAQTDAEIVKLIYELSPYPESLVPLTSLSTAFLHSNFVSIYIIFD